MRTPSYTNQFEKDIKRMQRRGKNIAKIKLVLSALIDEQQLEERYRDHALTGNYKNRRECHIEPDWLLIYRLIDNEIMFERTGSHSDLFE